MHTRLDGVQCEGRNGGQRSAGTHSDTRVHVSNHTIRLEQFSMKSHRKSLSFGKFDSLVGASTQNRGVRE